MEYSIIKGISIDDLIVNVNSFLLSNPLYEAVGNPIFISMYSGWAQVAGVDNNGGGGTTDISVNENLILYIGFLTASITFNVKTGTVPELFINGSLQRYLTDYTIVGTVLTWLNIDFLLDNTDNLIIIYIKQ